MPNPAENFRGAIPDAVQRETAHRPFRHPGTAIGGIRDRFERWSPLRSRIRRKRRSGMTKEGSGISCRNAHGMTAVNRSTGFAITRS